MHPRKGSDYDHNQRRSRSNVFKVATALWHGMWKNHRSRIEDKQSPVVSDTSKNHGTQNVSRRRLEEQPTNTALYQWLSMGDWGTRSSKQVAVAKRMDQVAHQVASQVVMCAGDNFYEYGVSGPPRGSAPFVLGGKSPSEASINTMMRKLKPDDLWNSCYFDVYRNSKLEYLSKLPFYLALGNHDYRGVPDAQIAFTYTDPTKLWRMPKNYYATRLPGSQNRVALIVIDTVVLSKPSKERWKHKRWIIQELQRCQDAHCIIVMGHYPLHSKGAHCGKDLNVTNKNSNGDDDALNNAMPPSYNSNIKIKDQVSKPNTIKRWLIDVFLKFNVDLYVNGHNHNLEYCGIQEATIGSNSAQREPRVLHCITTGSAAKRSSPPRDGCLFPLANLYHLVMPTGTGNAHAAGPSATLTNSASFVAPIFEYGFVAHALHEDCMLHTFHYMYNGDSNNESWKRSVVRTPLTIKKPVRRPADGNSGADQGHRII